MSLTLAEARVRAHQVSGLSYRLHLDLTDPASGSFGSRTEMEFVASAPETFLELADATDLMVEVDGVRVRAAYDGERIGLARARHRRPADRGGGRRAAALRDRRRRHAHVHRPGRRRDLRVGVLGMDVAQRVFACFDQNDLKAPITLAVTAPALDRARPTAGTVGGGRPLGRSRPRRRSRSRCSSSAPAPGTRSPGSHDAACPSAGTPGASLAAELDRDAAELRRDHRACFDHYAQMFEEPYPFDSYDQVDRPRAKLGRHGDPRAASPTATRCCRSSASPTAERRVRAMVIAHEMAHMWFGDLVTMRWWEDTWLQESFADYIGYRVAEEAAGFADTLVDFTIGRKPGLRRRRAPLHPPGRPARRGRARRRRGARRTSTRSPTPRATPRCASWSPGSATRPSSPASTPTWPGTGSATPPSTTSSPPSTTPPTATSAAWVRGLAAHHRLRHAPGHPRRRRAGPGPRGQPAAPAPRDDVRRRLAPAGLAASSTSATSRSGSRAAAVVVPNAAGETYARVRLDEQSWAAVTGDLADVPDDRPPGRCCGRPPSTWSGRGELRRRRLPRPGRPRHLPARAARRRSSRACSDVAGPAAAAAACRPTRRPTLVAPAGGGLRDAALAASRDDEQAPWC